MGLMVNSLRAFKNQAPPALKGKSEVEIQVYMDEKCKEIEEKIGEALARLIQEGTNET